VGSAGAQRGRLHPLETDPGRRMAWSGRHGWMDGWMRKGTERGGEGGHGAVACVSVELPSLVHTCRIRAGGRRRKPPPAEWDLNAR